MVFPSEESYLSPCLGSRVKAEHLRVRRLRSATYASASFGARLPMEGKRQAGAARLCANKYRTED